MLLSGDNHIPWGFLHSAAPLFPSLPQSFSCPWGMIFLMIILIMPSWLVIIIKIKYFIHNFPGYSAYDLTPHSPSTPTFLYLHYLINCLERKKKRIQWVGFCFLSENAKGCCGCIDRTERAALQTGIALLRNMHWRSIHSLTFYRMSRLANPLWKMQAL